MKDIHSLFTVLGGMVGLLVGFFLTFFGMEGVREAAQAAAVPSEVALPELTAGGVQRNAHVTLTAFTPRRDGCVVYHQEGQETWGLVMVPLGPAHGRSAPQAADVRVIAMTNRLRSQAELDKLLATTRLTGLIRSHEWRGPSADYLRSINPGIALDQCWEFWIDKDPWSMSPAAGLSGLGVLFFVLGSLLLYKGVPASSAAPSPDAQATVQVFATMSPLFLILQGIAALVKRLGISPRTLAILLYAAGLILVPAGFYVIGDALASLETFCGQTILGSFLLDLGAAFLLLGVAFHVRSARRTSEPEAQATGEAAAPPSSQQPLAVGRAVGQFLLVFGLMLFIAGVWIGCTQAVASNLVAGLVGVGVTGSLIGGALLLVASRETAKS
jgi:hypothetical protein